MRVAIVHHWLVNIRGGEKVLEVFCRMFPQADIFTHVVDEKVLTETLKRHKIKTTFIAGLPFSKKMYQKYLPLMPTALENLDLTGYDLVISIESGPAKGVITPVGSVHICYCNSPMRYLWDQYHVYKADTGILGRLAMFIWGKSLRQWDVSSAARVDGFIANSNHIANRIEKYWRRESDVVFPPAAIEDFEPVEDHELGEYYLWVGELASYKRPDLMIDAFNANGKKLIVIGGPEKTRKKLQERAKNNIEFLGKTDFETLKFHMARCLALIFPGEEDFGIVPVEAMASGRPVIAYGRGGALDTVIDGKTGILFEDQSIEGLNGAIEKFERDLMLNLNVEFLTTHVAQFDEKSFRSGIGHILADHGISVNFDIVANDVAIAS